MARLWLVTAATLLGVFVTVSLGFWQLSRAADKVALQQTIDARQRLPALDGSALLGEGDAAQSLYRSVVLRGSWLGGHTVFLDNRQMNGKPGFFVVTPLQLERSGRVVLVQRGWSARSFTDRSAVPDLPTTAGVVELQGRIAPPPSKLYEFEASQAGLIRQNLDLQQFSREIGRPLVTVSVLQTGPPGDGLLRDWPRVNLGVDKHYGYAFQWFALGGLITLLYGWFQVVKRFVAAR